MRHRFSLQLENSHNLEIQQCPTFRAEQQKKSSQASTGRFPPNMKASDYQAAIEKAVTENTALQDIRPFTGSSTLMSTQSQSLAINSWLPVCISEIEKATGQSSTLLPPSGTLEARIRIVLNHGFVNTELQDKFPSPRGIRESGFTESNALIWTFDLCRYALPGASFRGRPLPAVEIEILRKYNRELIKKNNLRVILMCGPCVAEAILGDDFPAVSFRLHGHDTTFQHFLKYRELIFSEFI